MKFRTLDLALASTRILSYSLLAFSIFFLAMCLGGWYEANILSSCEKGLGFELGRRDFLVRELDSQVVAFVSMPIVLAAALGGLYEALWMLRETESKASPLTSKYQGSSSINQFRTVLRFQFRPVIGSTVWISVGEFLLVLLWFVAMIAQMWQAIERNGSHYNEQIHPCRDDPKRWCSNEDGHPMATPRQWRHILDVSGTQYSTSKSSRVEHKSAALLWPTSSANANHRIAVLNASIIKS